MPPRKRTTRSFRCERYPELTLKAHGVSFKRGELDIDNPDTADAVAAMPEHYGIREVSDDATGSSRAVHSSTTRRADGE